MSAFPIEAISMIFLNLLLLGVNLAMYIWVGVALRKNDGKRPSIHFTKVMVLLLIINLVVLHFPSTMFFNLMSLGLLEGDHEIIMLVSRASNIVTSLLAGLGVCLMIYGIYKESKENEAMGGGQVE